MNSYRVISYRNVNSNGTTETQQVIIKANTDHGAKMQASGKYPTKGRWLKLDPGNGYVKGAHGNIIGTDRLFVIPLN